MRGYETHSSQIDRGVSAVMVAARLMMKLEALGLSSVKPNETVDSLRITQLVHVGLVQGRDCGQYHRQGCIVHLGRSNHTRSTCARRHRCVRDDLLKRKSYLRCLPNTLGCAIHTELLADAPGLECAGSMADSILVEDPKDRAGRKVRCIRNRGWPISSGWLRRCDLGTRVHRSGASARRMGFNGAARWL